MNENSKLIKIKTKNVDVKIYWNTKRVTTQFLILISVGLFLVFGEGAAIRNFCIALGFLDIVSIMFTSLVGGTADISDIDPETEKAAIKTSLDKKPKASLEKPKQAATTVPDEEIPNRVGVPAQAAVSTPVSTPAPEPEPEPIMESAQEEPMFADTDQASTQEEEAPAADSDFNTMTDEDWAEFFHF